MWIYTLVQSVKTLGTRSRVEFYNDYLKSESQITQTGFKGAGISEELKIISIVVQQWTKCILIADFRFLLA